MKTKEFDRLLLKTAFSCMVCDGDIDKETEVPFFKEFCEKSAFFNEINYVELINDYINSFNANKESFIKGYLNEMKNGKFDDECSLSIINVALGMIYADNIVKYEEIKFFKLIRIRLSISDEKIITRFPSKIAFLQTTDEDLILQMPDIAQFLEKDIVTDSFIDKITNQFLEETNLPKFELISLLNDSKA